VAAWAALLRAHAAVVPVLERELARRTGLPLSRYDVLLELASAEGGQLRMQDLAGRVVLSRTRVSRLVTDMVRDGLVEQVPDPSDGRAVLATITGAGRGALRRAAPTYLRGIQQHFADHLTTAQLRAVASALERVVAAHEDDEPR
jgi:DNA-binding MarR family transcriptional regulator